MGAKKKPLRRRIENGGGFNWNGNVGDLLKLDQFPANITSPLSSELNASMKRLQLNSIQFESGKNHRSKLWRKREKNYTQ